jgi:ABC-2 type transport system ATP-binding protein
MGFWDFIRNVKKSIPLSAESVKFAYNNKEILQDITLNVKENAITAIIGQSGSGKTTFLKLAAGIISDKYGGDIKIFGKSKIFKKNVIGFVPQEIALIPDLSILDNIKIAGLNLGITEEQALQKALELMKLLRLEEELQKKPYELSGGQRARLNIILSLLHEPKIVILDEPFVGLDFRNRRLLWYFLKSLKKKGLSIILTSHLLSETQEHADRLIILKKGRVFFNGDLNSLKNKLNIQFILEIKFSRLSKENMIKLKKYCDYKSIKILDVYERYIMFSLANEKTKEVLTKLFEKNKLQYEIIGFREPNLDEIFLNT